MFKKYKISNFTGRINAFRVIERMNILGGQNTENVVIFWCELCQINFWTLLLGQDRD